jgi:excisionase family DNA binding protein
MPEAPLLRVQDSPFLTPEEAAELARVHPQTIRRWIAARRLPAVRVGIERGRRVPAAALTRLLSEVADASPSA